MSTGKTVRLVLCWHMHQPDYRDHLRDEFQFPWTYLHAAKDYADMAAHLENAPAAKAVVNFSPVLLEQLEHYGRQFEAFRRDGTPFRDPLLAGLEAAVFPSEAPQRQMLVKACLRANRKHMIDRFAPYKRLVQIAELVEQETRDGQYLSNQYLADLIVWYHLAWLGEVLRTTSGDVQQFIEQGGGYTLHQRRVLLRIVGEQIASILPRYRALADQGRVELSVSPWGHPMLPLLLDFRATRAALPTAALPAHEKYPGGADRAAWHLAEGLRVFERAFGRRPAGCWPSEGGLSDEVLELLERAGFAWTAGGEATLRNSTGSDGRPNPDLDAVCSPWRRRGSKLKLFARSDSLSDLIGFTYHDWHADDAVADLVHRLEQIADRSADGVEPVVSIIMDGENAWEHYPRNGFYFLSALYKRLCEHPRIRLATFSELLDRGAAREFESLTAGSWVHGTFSTWMGNEDKNRAWDILADAKRACDEVAAAGHRERIQKQLAVCEGSDWFWWFGDYNPAAVVSDMERLFRLHVANLYEMLQREPPQYLSKVLAHGHGAPRLGGAMRPGSPKEPD
jgi:alpha-amylase/alpha-mannosidase (GH57 family)